MNSEQMSIDDILKECPEGGDPSNDCADCIYSAEYHLRDGACRPRVIEHDVRFEPIRRDCDEAR